MEPRVNVVTLAWRTSRAPSPSIAMRSAWLPTVSSRPTWSTTRRAQRALLKETTRLEPQHRRGVLSRWNFNPAPERRAAAA
jgi:hypothetical protein